MPINVIKDKTITNTGVPAVIDNAWSELLPSGYTQLEYIESTGTQYIDTGYVRTLTDDIECEFSDYSTGVLFGNMAVDPQTVLLKTGSSTFAKNMSSGGASQLTIQSTGNYKVLYKANGEIYVNGTLAATPTVGGVNSENMYIFAYKNASSVLVPTGVLKLNKLRIGSSRNLVPAKRNSDNTLGMYDIAWDGSQYGSVDLGTLTWTYVSPTSSAPNGYFVCYGVPNKAKSSTNQYLYGYTYNSSGSVDRCIWGSNSYSLICITDFRYTDAASFKTAMSGKILYYQRTTDTSWTSPFYTNAGAGVFTAGPAINTYTVKGNTVQTNNLLPVEYKAIDFIESHGTEYIDTGVIPNNETGIFTQLSIPNTSAETHPIGVRESDKRFSIDTTSTSQVCFGFGGYIQPQTDWNIANNEIFTASLNYLNNRKAKVNNGTELTLGTISTVLTNTIPLFARNYSTITGYACKIYQCKISQGSVLVRDMIPAKRLTDNVLGMYDKVEGKFYTNAGTGSFSGAEEMSINLFDMKYDVGYTGSYPNITTVAGGQSTEWIETSKFGQYFYFIWNVKEKLSNCVLGLVYSNDKSEILYRDGLVNASVVPAVNTDYVGGGGNPYKINSSYTYVKFYFLNWANVNHIGIYTTLQNTFIPYGQIPADTDNTCDIPSPTHPVELHSVGDKTENLFDGTITNFANAGTVGVNTNYRSITVPVIAGETYTFKRMSLPPTASSNRCGYFFTKEYPYSGLSIYGAASLIPTTMQFSVTAHDECTYFTAYFDVGGVDISGTQMMFVEGTTAPTSYVPYGYNLPLFHRCDCGVVDLGTLTWNKLTTYDTIRFVSSPYHDAKPTADNSTVGNIYMEGMTTYSTNGLIASTNDGVAISSTSMIAFRITAYNNMTADQFKQTISGKYLYYQRATDTSWTTPTLNNLYLSEPLRKVGNYSDYISYGDGKNLFDKTGATSGYLNSSGTLVSHANLYNTDYLAIPSGTTALTQSFVVTSTVNVDGMNAPAMCFYDSNKTFISGHAFGDGTSYAPNATVIYSNITVPSNAKYFRTCYRYYNDTSYYDKIQVEAGTTATPYQPFSNTPKVVRNIGVKVLDGTENWQSYTYQTNPLSFYLIFSDMIDTTASTSSDNFYNTHLTFVPTVWGNSDIGFACSTLKRMFMRRNITDTTETWKSWLATQYTNGNPVIIYYPLATPTYEAITLPELPVELHNKLNLYNVETKLAPSEISVTYRGNMTEGHKPIYNSSQYSARYNNQEF